MPKIIATGGGTDEDLNQNPLKALWEKFASLDKFSKTLVMTTVLFLVFASAVTTITLSLRSNAGGGGIARVEVHPGVLNLLAGEKQAMSTLAYDYNGNPVFSGVVYEWSMSSASSAATLSKTIGDITELTALKIGCAQLTVIARDGIQTVTRSLPVVISDSYNTLPSCANITPTPSERPIGIGSEDVDLNAGNFYIEIDGKKYYGTKPMDIHNNISQPYPSATSLETIWHENGVEMRLFIYFRAYISSSSATWEIYDIRTYDGNSQGEWLYYPADRSWGNFGNLGYSASWQKLDLVSKDGKGLIHFDTLKLFPFKNYKTATPTPAIPGPFYLKTGAIRKLGGNKIGVTLSWSQSANAVKYNVYQRNDKAKPYGPAIAGIGGLSYEAIVNGTLPNYFQVQACNANTCVKSNDVYVPFQITPTPTPVVSNYLELDPVADAYVRSDLPNKNYGSGVALRVDGKPNVNSYLKFDLRQLTGKKITGAKLGLYVLDVKGSSSPGTQSLVNLASSSWTENSITYRNAPGRTSVFASYTKPVRNTFIYFDIQNWVKTNQGKFASFALLNSSDNEAVVGAREQDNKSFRPKLIIYFENAPTPTFPPPPTYTPTP